MINKPIGLYLACVTLICSYSSISADVGVNAANGVASLTTYGNGGQRDGRVVEPEKIRSRSINNIASEQLPTDKLDEIRSHGFAKDSYGNPVTPFALSDDDIGQRNGAVKDSNGFLLPSYASGIIGFVDPNLPIPKLNLNLEPPQSSGNFYYPGVNSQTSTEIIPRVQTPKTTTAQPKPSAELLPPHETDFNSFFNQPNKAGSAIPSTLPPRDTNSFFNQPSKTPSTPSLPPRRDTNSFFNQPSTPSPKAPAVDLLPPHETSQLSNRFEDNRIIFNTDKTTKSPPVVTRPPPPLQIPVTVVQAPLQIPVAIQSPPPPPKKATVQKYTGGFGGAPGLLSPFQNTKQEPNKAAFTQASSSEVASTVQAPIIQQQPIVQQPPPVQVPNRFDEVTTKYTGGFGGPPGFLTPFDNIHEFSRFNPNN